MKNRIKEHRKVRVGDLVPHELNPRVHGEDQRDALRALLGEIGFARSVLAYELPDGRLKLIDGHLRQSELNQDELVKESEWQSEQDRACLQRLRAANDDLRHALDLAIEFALLIRKKATRTFAEWLASAEASANPDLRSFVAGLRADEAAVRAAIETPWSNGPIEGQVNRLKTIKRQMNGRAALPLLRARALHAA